jgi:hypothetical protein
VTMSVAGLCQVCDRARADRQCPRCGSLVCDDHFDDGNGVCADCASGGTPGGMQL